MPVRCEDLAVALAESADGVLPDARAQRHVDGCLRCQAELAQYRKLLRTLHSLRTELLAPNPGLVSDVLAAIEAAGERQAVRSLVQGRWVAYVGGLAAATAAAGAGAVFVLTTRRNRRLRPTG